MGAFFTAASSTGLFNAAPVLPAGGVPLTMAAWFNASSTGHVIGLYDTAVTNTWLACIFTTATSLTASSNTVGTAVSAAGGSIPLANQWTFVLARFISSTNRWNNWLQDRGGFGQAQNVTSNTPTSLDTFAIGHAKVSTPTAFIGGIVAEAWYADSDIPGADPAAALDPSLLRKIAFEGPFSYPPLAEKIVEWRGLRKTLTADAEGDYDTYSRIGPATWQASATRPIITNHPPLSPYYVHPGQVQSLLMV